MSAMEVLSVLQTAAFQQRRDELYSSKAQAEAMVADSSGQRI